MSSLILDTALELAAAGLAVHWLWPRSKIPFHEGYQHMPWTSPEELARQWSRRGRSAELNIGLHTGRVVGARFHVIGVDLDSQGARNWADIHLPRTPIRNLSPKGEHRLYRHPGGIVRNRVKIRVDGIRIDLDLRGDGGNLAIAPSIHPSGPRYVAPEPWTAESLAAMPMWDPFWIPADPEQSLAPNRSTATDDQALLERGRRLAIKWQVSERGFGQGTEAFKLAGYLQHRIGLSEAATFDVMWTHYNPRCSEPYTEPLLRRKVQQAATRIRSTALAGGSAGEGGGRQ